MSKIRRIVSRIVGGIQCGLGCIAIALAFMVYANQSIRDALAIALTEVYLYMFLFLVFGMFSVLSGLPLLREKNRGS